MQLSKARENTVMHPEMARELLRARQQDWSRRQAGRPAPDWPGAGAEKRPGKRRRRGAFSALRAAAGLQPRGR
jgi:hypothetical protein